MTRHKIPLTSESWLTLQRMAKGSVLRGTRVFPFPLTFKLSKVPGPGDYAAAIAPKTIDQLVTLRLVTAAPERQGDLITYAMTARAESALERGELFEDDHAIEMFAEAR